MVLGLVLLVVLGMVVAMVASAAASTSPDTTATTVSATPTVAAPTADSSAPAPDLTDESPVPAAQSKTPIVVLGTTDLTWADVTAIASGQATTGSDATPAGLLYVEAAQQILALAKANTPVNVVVRAGGEFTCTDDGWVTVSAGRRTRAAALTSQGTCGDTGTWDDTVAASKAAGYDAQPGLLADTLTMSSRTPAASFAAIGDGGVLALTTSDGTAPTTATGMRQLLSATMASTGSTTPVLPDLTVWDTTPIAGTTAGAKVADAPSEDAARLLSLSQALAQVPEEARIVVVSVGDSEDPGLQMGVLPAGSSDAAASAALGTGSTTGEGVSEATLAHTITGPSTHRVGLIQLTDLATTLLTELRGAAPNSMTGGVIHLPKQATAVPAAADAVGTSGTTVPAQVAALADDALHARASDAATVPAGLLLVASLAGLAALTLRRWRLTVPDLMARNAALTQVSTAALGVLALTPALYLVNLVPWWRVGAVGDRPSSAATVTALVLATVAAGIVVVASARVTRRADTSPLGADPRSPGRRGTVALVLVGLTVGLILADGATGAHLTFNGPLGMNSVVAGRFYGVNNTAFAQAGAGIVILLGALAGLVASRGRRTGAVVLVAVAGLAAVALDGAPELGADVGGAITLLVTLGVLAAGVARWRLTWRRILMLGVGAVAVVGALAVVDYTRPVPSRTHLGRFMADVVAGQALGTIARKAGSIVAPFVSSGAAAVALMVGVSLLVLLVWEGRRTLAQMQADQGPYAWLAQAAPATGWAAGSWVGAVARALTVLVALEVALNDSGLVMFWFSVAVALPAALVLAASALDRGPALSRPDRRVTGPDPSL